MQEIKIENWNEYKIRFVWHNGEWWAIARDICDALNIKLVTRALSGLPKKGIHIMKTPTKGGKQKVNIINEQNIYSLIFKSRKREAEEFQDWVYNMLKELRQSTGLEGFQIFRMLDKEHQKEAMAKLKAGLKKPVRIDFIKANTIANKATSNMFGHPKMLKKNEMTPDMLVKRENVLEDTVELMTMKDKFNLSISVSESIYKRYQ